MSAFDAVSVLDVGDSRRCSGLSRRCCHLHFPGDVCREACFHMLTRLRQILSDEVWLVFQIRLFVSLLLRGNRCKG